MVDLQFYRGRRVLVTGHTGFKGSWLIRILKNAGAVVTGYSLTPPTDPSLFALSDGASGMTSVIGDVRDYAALSRAFEEAKPEVVFHLAAQPIVRIGYRDPVGTFETNVMGTVKLLECVRNTPGVRSVLNVTTDKVYENRETGVPFGEDERLDGADPYSNSKSCSELVTHSYKKSYLDAAGIAVSTARAGNVIGGGDYAADRILPDCVRAAIAGGEITVRNPYSVRPYQHVLEPLFAYLTIAERQVSDPSLAGYYNVGPDEGNCATTGEVADLFCRAWGNGCHWVNRSDGGPREAGFLRLDCAKLKGAMDWRPVWDLERAIRETAEFEKHRLAGGSVSACMDAQIAAYAADAAKV